MGRLPELLKGYYRIDIQVMPLIVNDGNKCHLKGRVLPGGEEIEMGNFYMPKYSTGSNGNPQFDCSQMAALMEYYLERSGIRAKIAVTGNLTTQDGEVIASNSNVPSSRNYTHAFVIIDAIGGPYYIDTASPDYVGQEKLEILSPANDEYNKPYYKYREIYDSIYDVIKAGHLSSGKNRLYEEFSWWQSLLIG